MRNDDGRDKGVAGPSSELKVVPFTPKAKPDPEAVKHQAEMVAMLESALESLKKGEITGYMFVGRNAPSESNSFEYIFANVMDIGLIGEITVLTSRLVRMYDAYSEERDEESE